MELIWYEKKQLSTVHTESDEFDLSTEHGGRVDKANVVMMQLIKMVTFLAEGWGRAVTWSVWNVWHDMLSCILHVVACYMLH